MTKSRYSICFVVVTLLLIFLQMIQAAVSSVNAGDALVFMQLIHLAGVAVFLYACAAPRIKSLGKNPWLALLGLLPLFGCIYLLYLCFADQKTNQNSTVEVSFPEKKNQSGQSEIVSPLKTDDNNSSQEQGREQSTEDLEKLVNDGSKDTKDYTKLIK